MIIRRRPLKPDLSPFLLQYSFIGTKCPIFEIAPRIASSLLMIHLLLDHLELAQLVHLLLQLVVVRATTIVLQLLRLLILLVKGFEFLKRGELILVLHLVDVLVVQNRLQGGMLRASIKANVCDPTAVLISVLVEILICNGLRYVHRIRNDRVLAVELLVLRRLVEVC